MIHTIKLHRQLFQPLQKLFQHVGGLLKVILKGYNLCFSRLIDPKELVRQPCCTTLEIVGKTYSVDSLLPALFRSLDEQRSPKAKLVVIDFANKSFNRHTTNSDGYSNSGFLKLWLAKLAPLVTDKNTKLKEASISGIISVYSHFDTSVVLNIILSLSIQEQNSLRRALKQYTPRIEVDLMNFLQNKRERQRSKSFYDQPDVIGNSSEDGYFGSSKKSQIFGRYFAGSVDSDGGRKWSSVQESTQMDASIGQAASDEMQHPYCNFELNSDNAVLVHKSRELMCDANIALESTGSWTSHREKEDCSVECVSSLATSCLDINRLVNYNGARASGLTLDIENMQDMEAIHENLNSVENNPQADSCPSIPQILHQICNSNDDNENVSKCEALQQLVEASTVNNNSIWTKYFNQILTAVLEVLNYPDPTTRELAISLIVEMVNNLKEAMEDSFEFVIEKLLHATKDVVPKVSNEANQCLTTILVQYDPLRFLSVIVPLLVSADEKTLVVCIKCLTKLVGQLSQEELMTHLPSFLPALFDAFGNQSPDVRKTVVFCLVDICIMHGKAFLPYLEGLRAPSCGWCRPDFSGKVGCYH